MGKLKKLNSCIYFVSDGEYIKIDQNLVKEEIYNLFPCSPAGLYYHLKTNDDEESLFNDIDILEKIKKDNNVVGPGRRY